jgi:hypothetical protein
MRDGTSLAHVVRSMRVLGCAGAPTRAQQSNTDQQMPFRNRWSSRTSARIATGSWSRCHRHSSRLACSPAPCGAAPGALGLHLLLGADIGTTLGNHVRNLAEGRIRIVEGVFERP